MSPYVKLDRFENRNLRLREPRLKQRQFALNMLFSANNIRQFEARYEKTIDPRCEKVQKPKAAM